MNRLNIAAAAFLIGSGGLMGSTPAEASSRTILIENFTATWCGYCPSVSNAIVQVMADYPGQTMGFQVHGSDSYTCAWGNSRLSFYNVGGFPTVWIDGWWSQVGTYGSESANYNNLISGMNAAMNRSTDVVISSAGEETSNSQYSMTWNLGVETGGQARTVRFYAVQALDVYPSGGTHYFNCVIQHRTESTHALSPGQNVEINHTWELSGASLENKDDVIYIAWAQDVSGSGPSQIHNVDAHGHGELPPATVTVGTDGDFATISEAIENVGNNSTINVGPGVYEEHINLGGKNLAIIGTEGSESTVIDGMNSGPVLTMLSYEGDETLIQGLTLANGSYIMGAGVSCNGNPVIRDCIISNNTGTGVDGAAGLMSVGTSGPTLDSVLFCNNLMGDESSHIWGNWTDAGGVIFEDDCQAAPCDGDFNGDTSVGVDDLLEVIGGWGNPYTVDDLLQVIANWGSDC